MKRYDKEPIAIVGMGCRFPGGANNLTAFWELLQYGGDAIVDVPADRWNSDKFYDPEIDKPGKSYVRRGGFLTVPMDQFDPSAFGISPREAEFLDPQQRLLLEVVWHALEDAGIPMETIKGTPTGVYIGGFTLDNLTAQLNVLNRHLIGTHTAISVSMAMLSNRVSHTFDFRGPSITIDTACSSSLVALHYACNGIWNGDVSLAVCGGVSVMFRPEYSIMMAKGRFLSPDGRCKAFDATADGYGRGEGAGIVILKRLSAAIDDGDRIYALIRNTGVNQDGHTPGITLPNRSAQEALLQSVYGQAGIAATDIQYVEAHGTGTQAGDTAEARALGTIIGLNRRQDAPCLIGTVKTNIGHLEAAAGVAGLIKTVLSLQHRQIPPNLHFRTPNPAIDFDALRLRIPTAAEPWPDVDGPRIAGVNAFGYGGTNAHAIVQGYESNDTEAHNRNSAAEGAPPTMITLSACNTDALDQMVANMIDFLESDASGKSASIHDLCHTTLLRRTHHPHRIAAPAATRSELLEQFRRVQRADPETTAASGRAPSNPPKLVFVYSGMGPQSWSMGRSLLQSEPVFRDAVSRCDSAFRSQSGWSLIDELLKNESDSRISQPEVAQPANFAIQVGLTDLWASWGVQPDAIVGHSVGEVAAAYVAGALSFEEAVAVSYHRSRLQQSLKGQGSMLMAAIDRGAAREEVAKAKGRIALAAVNSTTSVVLSGDSTVLGTISESLNNADVFNRFLDVNVAYHSDQMDPLADELMDVLGALCPRAPDRRLYSTVLGTEVCEPLHDARYWWRNLRETVAFAAAIRQLLRDGYSSFLEIGAHPVLGHDIQSGAVTEGVDSHTFFSLNRDRDDRQCLLETMGKMYCAGVCIAWCRFCGDHGRYVKLPSYPFQRKSYFLESEASRTDRLQGDVHPLLGHRLHTAVDAWEVELNTANHGFLSDHKIADSVVFPAAAYVEMALALAHQIAGDRSVMLQRLAFTSMLVMRGTGDATILQTSYNKNDRSWAINSTHSHERKTWSINASGRRLHGKLGVPRPLRLDDLRNTCPTPVDRDALYAELRRHSLAYGPAFQALQTVHRGSNQAFLTIRLNDALLSNYKDYFLHPTVLDAALQGLLVAAAPFSDKETSTYVPVEIGHIIIYRSPPRECVGHARVTDHTKDDLVGELKLCDDQGELCAELSGVRCRRLDRPGMVTPVAYDDWLYAFDWTPADNPSQFHIDKQNPKLGSWLIFADTAATSDRITAVFANGGLRCIHVFHANTGAAGPGVLCCDRPGNLDAMKTLMAGPDVQDVRGALYICDAEHTSGGPSADHQASVCMTIANLMTAASEQHADFRLVLLSQASVHMPADDPLGHIGPSAIWGLGRVIMSEFPACSCQLIDIDATDESLEKLIPVIESGGEEEIGIRKGQVFVRRLSPIDASIRSNARQNVSGSDDVDFELAVREIGVLGSLHWRETAPSAPGPRDIAIRVESVPLNYKDVLKAKGMLSARVIEGTFVGDRIGVECTGVVAAIGTDVHEFQCGDKVVVALAGTGCFGTSVTMSIDENYILRIPDELSLEGSGVFVPYLTVLYSLREVARLRKNEAVLIHSATGGVGLAAVNYALSVGARIFATAGSETKREYLRSMGIDHVFDSRSLSFANEIMAITNGHGVDVALNSLTGDALAQTLSIMAAYGRFVEIGKVDIDEDNGLQLRPFNKNLTFAAVDLDRMALDRRDFVYQILRDIRSGLIDGTLKPLPIEAFAAADVADAFRQMEQARHIGRIEVKMRRRPVSIVPAQRNPISSDRTYVVTGGLGGFGFALARDLVQRGARHLLLASRRGAATAQAEERVQSLREAGCKVHIHKADVSRLDEVEEMFAAIRDSGLPLAGIIHAAGILDDRWLAKMDVDAFKHVLAPKIDGSWNLHVATLDTPLDFFILCSSVTAILGTPGQGNYAAANAFMDELARYRNHAGLPATSVNWGAVADVGMVADNDDARVLLNNLGIRPASADNLLTAMDYIFAHQPSQIGVMDVNWSRWKESNPVSARSPRFVNCAGNDPEHDLPLPRSLDLGEGDDRLQKIQDLLCTQLASVLRVSADEVDIQRPLTELGLDSLLATELISSIRTTFGVQLSPTDLMLGATVERLGGTLNERLELSAL